MDDDMMEELRMRGISVEDYIKKNMMAAEGGEDDLEDELHDVKFQCWRFVSVCVLCYAAMRCSRPPTQD